MGKRRRSPSPCEIPKMFWLYEGPFATFSTFGGILFSKWGTFLLPFLTIFFLNVWGIFFSFRLFLRAPMVVATSKFKHAEKLICLLSTLGYNPSGLSVYPPPRMIEGACVNLFLHQFFFLKKVDFVGDIRIGTHQNVVLRHNHLNPISTKLTSFDNNE